MSDSEPDFDDPRFVLDVPSVGVHEQTYAEKRRRKAIDSDLRGRTKSRAQLEQEQREIGLSRNLIDTAASHRGNGEDKAFKMMQAMGFKAGDSLGKASDPPRFAKASFAPAATSSPPEPSTSTTSTSIGGAKPANEPIKFQIRT
ncbi:hypothetical protein JCM11491_000150, partial [Sporobolomyces phaffii]